MKCWLEVLRCRTITELPSIFLVSRSVSLNPFIIFYGNKTRVETRKHQRHFYFSFTSHVCGIIAAETTQRKKLIFFERLIFYVKSFCVSCHLENIWWGRACTAGFSAARLLPAWNRKSSNTVLNSVPLKNSCHSVNKFGGNSATSEVKLDKFSEDPVSTSCEASLEYPSPLSLESLEVFSWKKRATVQNREQTWQHRATHFNEVVRFERFSSQVCRKAKRMDK